MGKEGPRFDGFEQKMRARAIPQFVCDPKERAEIELREENGSLERVLIRERSKDFNALEAAFYGAVAAGAIAFAAPHSHVREDATSVRNVIVNQLQRHDIPLRPIDSIVEMPEQPQVFEPIRVRGFREAYGIPDEEVSRLFVETLPPGILANAQIAQVMVTPETGTLTAEYFDRAVHGQPSPASTEKIFEGAHYRPIPVTGKEAKAAEIVIRSYTLDPYFTTFHEFGHNRRGRELEFYSQRLRQGRRLRIAYPEEFVVRHAGHPEDTDWVGMAAEYRSEEDGALLSMQLRPGESFEDAGTRVLVDRYGSDVPQAEQIAREDVRYYMKVNGGIGYNWEVRARDRAARIHRFEVLRQEHELNEFIAHLPDPQLQLGARALQREYVHQLEQDISPYPYARTANFIQTEAQIQREVETSSPFVRNAFDVWMGILESWSARVRRQSRLNPNVPGSQNSGTYTMPWASMLADVPSTNTAQLTSDAKGLQSLWGQLSSAERDQLRAWCSRLLHAEHVEARSRPTAGAVAR